MLCGASESVRVVALQGYDEPGTAGDSALAPVALVGSALLLLSGLVQP